MIKVTLLLALSLAIVSLLRRATASTRHAILMAGQVAALAVPLLTMAIPPLAVPVQPAMLTGSEPFIGVISTSMPAPPLPVRRSMDWVLLLWSAGCAFAMLTRAASLLRAASIIRNAAPFGEALISDAVISNAVDQPSTLGRTIVLPAAARQWDAARLRAVLLHERAHVARRDSLTGLLTDVVCAIYWFHPLAWISARWASLERERACDDAVLAQGIDPRDYAAAILEVARATVRRGVGLPMAARPHLEQRIRAILNPSVRRSTSRLSRIAVLILALTIAPLVAAVTTLSIARPEGMEPDLLGDAVASPFSELLDVEPALGRRGDPDAVDAELIAVMEQLASMPATSSIDFVAHRARWALTQVRDGRLVEPLLESLEHHDWRVRAYAAFALGVARDRRATPGLVRLLGHPVWRVRAMTASALARIADPAARPAMHRALSDDAWQVRSEAVQYFRVTSADRTLFETMLRDRHVAVRTKAQEALQ